MSWDFLEMDGPLSRPARVITRHTGAICWEREGSGQRVRDTDERETDRWVGRQTRLLLAKRKTEKEHPKPALVCIQIGASPLLCSETHSLALGADIGLQDL